MSINRVVLTGNLTRDPELRASAGGGSVCKLGLAVNTRRKNGQTGEWEEKPNFFRVTVFGRQADSCDQYLSKGRPIAVDGRLEWSQYEVDGQKRESIEIVADTIQFLGSRDDAGNGTGASTPAASAASSPAASDTGDFDAPVAAAAAPVSDDDIPF
jgi:single-strand DNA-binding protein